MKKYSSPVFALILIIFSFAVAGLTGPAFAADASTATNISAGNYHTLIITDGGKVLASGRNAEGQLGDVTKGDGTNKTSFAFVVVKNLSDVSAVSAGGKFSLALKKDGTVWAWGDNTYGQLGDGTTEMRTSPVQVPGLSDVIAIGAGGTHALALKKDGTVWTWGENSYGQFGNGTTAEKNLSPAQSPDLTDIKAIGAGDFNSFALSENGDIWAMGRYNDGELGDGSMSQGAVGGYYYQSTPVQIISGVKDISVGNQHVLALMDDLTVYTWGKGISPDPVKVPSLSKVKAIAAGGYHSLAIKQDGTLWAWGENYSGQLGNGEYQQPRTSTVYTPVQVKQSKDAPDKYFSKATAIAGGYLHSIAIAGSGALWAWGDNSDGQLGTKLQEGSNSSYYPVSINSAAGGGGGTGGGTTGGGTAGGGGTTGGTAGGTSGGGTKGGCVKGSGKTGNIFQDVATSICEGPKDKTVTPGKNEKPWSGVGSDIGKKSGGGTGGSTGGNSTGGGSTSGGSGTGGTTGGGSQSIADFKAIAISAGEVHTLAVAKDKIVWAWGRADQGQLGTGSPWQANPSPEKVKDSGGKELEATAVSAGYWHSAAILMDGTVMAWGYNKYGELGNGSNVDSLVPVHVKGLTKVKAISAGAFYTLALRDDGSVWAWGTNSRGQLGTGSSQESSNIPVKVKDISNAKAIYAGEDHALALVNDGAVWAWGNNDEGQIGDGTRQTDNTIHVQATPVQVLNLANVKGIAAGLSFSLAVLTDGTVWEWGGNKSENGSSVIPVQVSGLSNANTIAAGGYHAIVIKKDGTLWAWGADSQGQVGDGKQGSDLANGMEKTPKQVKKLTNAIVIDGGGSHSVAIKKDLTVWGWGEHTHGQLGLGETGTKNYSTPTKVTIAIK